MPATEHAGTQSQATRPEGLKPLLRQIDPATTEDGGLSPKVATVIIALLLLAMLSLAAIVWIERTGYTP